MFLPDGIQNGACLLHRQGLCWEYEKFFLKKTFFIGIEFIPEDKRTDLVVSMYFPSDHKTVLTDYLVYNFESMAGEVGYVWFCSARFTAIHFGRNFPQGRRPVGHVPRHLPPQLLWCRRGRFRLSQRQDEEEGECSIKECREELDVSHLMAGAITEAVEKKVRLFWSNKSLIQRLLWNIYESCACCGKKSFSSVKFGNFTINVPFTQPVSIQH